jgi:outer membrane autotransporter protein
MAHRMQPPKLKVSTLALSAALAAMTPAVALAAPPCVGGPISAGTTTTLQWSNGNCSITNTGSIVVPTPLSTGLAASGTVGGTLTNSGIISATLYGIYNTGTVELDNSGAISGATIGAYGILNAAGATITALNNQANGTINGTISGVYAGISNYGSITALSNQTGAVISSDEFAILNNGGTIGTLNNSGAIVGTVAAIYNPNGTIDTLINSGMISGAAGISNAGTIGTLTNSGLISSQGNGIANGTNTAISTGSIGTLTNSGTISSGGTGISNTASIDTLTNSGTINSQGKGIANTATGGSAGSIGTLTNNGTISSTAIGIDNTSGTITALNNDGVINSTAVGISNSGTITALNNDGVINSSNDIGISNDSGTIGTLVNNGSISGAGFYAINNAGSITTLSNNGAIVDSTNTAIANSGTIDTLTNGGNISGGVTGVYSPGNIGVLTNSGSIGGAVTGIYNGGNIGVLDNASGSAISVDVTSGSYAVFNAGTITSLTNDGLIAGRTGVRTQGDIGTLVNSGTITGSLYAFYNAGSGTIGAIANSGVMAGEIRNTSVRDLHINGGTGTVFGTLTGFGGTSGVITNTAANVAFDSGNLLLNDNINVGANAVNNTGTAVLQVNQGVTITGNYNQGAGATLQIGVSSGATTPLLGSITDTGYGRLVVTGNATIASGSSVTLQSNGYTFAAGQRYVVVDTAGTAVYNASSLNYSINGSTLTVTGSVAMNGSNSDLVLNVVSAPPTSSPAAIANAPNAVAALNGLLNYTGISDPALLKLYNAALGSLTPGSAAATANQIGKQLGPTQPTAAAAAPTTDALNVVGAHVDSLRVAQAAQAAGETGVATGEGALQSGVWGQAYGGHASQNERDQVDGYNANYGGLLIGVDTAINDNWRAGGAFTYSNTKVNSTGDITGDTASINSYGLIGYASYTGNPWYVNLSGAVIEQHYDTTRAVNFPGFSGTANGRFSGQQYVARAEAGYPLALGGGGLALTPLASLTYSYQNLGSYTESGGNGAALSVDATHANSVQSGLGAKLEQTFSTSYGEIVPDLQVQWIHEYDHTAQVTGASFAADPTGQTAFTTVGAAPVPNLVDLSLGVTLLKANNLSLSVRYELQAGSGFVSQTGMVRLRQLF